MIRVVLDANVLIAALPATSGTLAEIIDHWRAGRFEIAASSFLLAEVARSWRKPYWSARMPADQAGRLMKLLELETIQVPLTASVDRIATHPEDDLILATAISAGARYLITGDKQLLALQRFKGVSLLAPSQFLSILQTEKFDQP